MEVIRFFNDWQLCKIHNMKIQLGKPQLIPDAVFIDPFVDVAWGYPSVFRDEQTGKWKMLYQGQYSDRLYYPLMAESEDGIKWYIPDLSKKIAMKDRKFPHQILPKEHVFETHIAYYDRQEENPLRRLKLLIDSQTQVNLATSPDAINWTLHPNIRWHKNVSDPAASIFYNKLRGSWIISVRPRSNDRRICFIETSDWQSFSYPILVMEPDVLDQPLTQCYGMPVFDIGDIFVGFLWLYQTEPESIPFKFLHGKVDCQLVFSRNGWNFHRFIREPFLGDFEPNQFGFGCIYPSTLLTMDDGSYQIYSSASKGEHATIYANPESRQGAILLHTLRKDGFAFLETQGGAGEIITRQLWITGDKLELNAWVPYGELWVEILDSKGNVLPGYELSSCKALSGDCTQWQPVWSHNLTFSNLKKKSVIMLRIKIDRGRLYAIRGDFKIVYPSQVQELGSTGDIVSFLEGF